MNSVLAWVTKRNLNCPCIENMLTEIRSIPSCICFIMCHQGQQFSHAILALKKTSWPVQTYGASMWATDKSLSKSPYL